MLSVDSLRLHRGGKAVLHGIDLQVPPGQVTALLGANGAGKSSTVMAIGGVLPLSGGRIEVAGHALHGQRPERVRARGVAVVPEGHRVLGDLSVLDNLRAAATALPAGRVADAVEQVLAVFPELRVKLALPARSRAGRSRWSASRRR